MKITLVSFVVLVVSAQQLLATDRDIVPPAYTLDIYTAFVPPYAQPEPKNQVSGTLVSTVTEYLKARHLDYQISLLPWSAAFKRTQLNAHALLFPVDRTHEREEAFHWIKPLVITEYYLYGIAGSEAAALSLDQAIENGALITCGNNSVQCQILSAKGFSDESIVRIEDASIPKRYELMMLGRNQYSVFDPKVYQHLTKLHGLDPQKLVKMHKIGELKSYLAAGKDMPEDMLRVLLSETD